MYCILEILSVECVNEPMGAGGLEGFVRGAQYMVALVYNPRNNSTYYKVYHTGDYYETCGSYTLWKHFRTCKPAVSNEFDFNFMLGYTKYLKEQINQQYAK